MGILEDNPLSFSDASVLTEAVALFYQKHEDSRTVLKYFGDMREASSLFRHDNMHFLAIQKVHDLAQLAQVLHKSLLRMTAETAALLDREALGKTHPHIVAALGEFEEGVRAFRQQVRMFGDPEALPAEARKSLESKTRKAVTVIETIRDMPSVPIAFSLPDPKAGGTPKIFHAAVPQPKGVHELHEYPGILMVALQYAARGGIVDSHRSPEAALEFYSRTVGVAMTTAARREELAGMIRKKLSRKFSPEDIGKVVPDLLRETDLDMIAESTTCIPPHKRNFLLRLLTLDRAPAFTTLSDWITFSLQEEGHLEKPASVKPASAQEAFLLLKMVVFTAHLHEKFDYKDVTSKDLRDALDNTYTNSDDKASLKAFGEDPRVSKTLELIKPFLEPSSPEMKAYYDIEALVPPKSRPGGGERPKTRRNR